MGNIHCLNKRQQSIERIAELFKEHIVVSRGIQCENSTNFDDTGQCIGGALEQCNGAGKGKALNSWRPYYLDDNREDDMVESISTLNMPHFYGKWNTNNNLLSRECNGNNPFHQNNSNIQFQNGVCEFSDSERPSLIRSQKSRPNDQHCKLHSISTFQNNQLLPRGLKNISLSEDRTTSYTCRSTNFQSPRRDSSFDDIDDRNQFYSDEDFRESDAETNGVERHRDVRSHRGRGCKKNSYDKYQSSTRTRTMDNTSKDADDDHLSFSSESTVHNNKNSDENNPSVDKSAKTSSTLREFANFIKRKRKKKLHKTTNDNATNCSDDVINNDNTHNGHENSTLSCKFQYDHECESDEALTPPKPYNNRPTKERNENSPRINKEINESLHSNQHLFNFSGSQNRLSILPPHQGPNGRIPILVSRPAVNRRPYFTQCHPRNRPVSMVPQNEAFPTRRRSLSSSAVLNCSSERVCQSPSSSRAGTPNAARGYRTPTLLWKNSMTPIRGGSNLKSESPRILKHQAAYDSNYSLNRSIPSQRERNIVHSISNNDSNLTSSNSKLTKVIPADSEYIQAFGIPESYTNQSILSDVTDKRLSTTCDRYNCRVLDVVPKSSRRQCISLILSAPSKEAMRRCLLSIDRTMKWSLTQQLK